MRHKPNVRQNKLFQEVSKPMFNSYCAGKAQQVRLIDKRLGKEDGKHCIVLLCYIQGITKTAVYGLFIIAA